MQTKFLLNIGNEQYELQNDDLFNWADIECSYKRSGYDGVVRSFMSKFQFINEARRLLIEEFDTNGLMAKASVTLLVINDHWKYDPLFSCDLDFTTFTYDDYTASINAVDASVAARIKANKSTRYEFEPGQDITMAPYDYLFDRMEMIESASYHISDGESQDDGSIKGSCPSDSNGRIMIGLTESEIAVGQAVYFTDDQEYGNGFLIEALKPVNITLDYSIVVNRETGAPQLTLMLDNTPVEVMYNGSYGHQRFVDGDWSNENVLMAWIEEDKWLSDQWHNNMLEYFYYWAEIQGMVWLIRSLNEGPTCVNYFEPTGKTVREYFADPVAGSVSVQMQPQQKLWIAAGDTRTYCFMSSKLVFSWVNRGEPVVIDCVKPLNLLEALLAKMNIDCTCSLSCYDPRLDDVVLLPGECIRELNQPRVFASFNDFAGWMEAVFGYVYVIDEENHTLEFKHRKEIFREDAPVFEVTNGKDFTYSLENSVLYSNLVIGYNKQDYDSINGRNEFNFSNSYTTSFSIEGKKLELKSAFRADGYGIEFLVEKRGKETTDNQSDTSMFFVSGTLLSSLYRPERPCTVTNTASAYMLNAEFSPLSCIKANADSISLMAKDMTLVFASADGDGSVVIDGQCLSGNVVLEDCEMLTAGVLKFTCPELSVPQDINSLIRVRAPEYIYDGYISEITMKYAREEAVEYKLLVKSKTPCA